MNIPNIDTWSKSWKTTVIAIFTAIMGFVSYQPDYFPPMIVAIAKYLSLIGVVGTGLVTKDYNVSGTGGPVISVKPMGTIESTTDNK
jgi:hypothetical protein